MTSVIRSDLSFSTRFFRGRGGSAASVVDRFTDAKQVTQLSAVIGNGARDRALQFNGDVADKINTFNCKYCIIFQCEPVRSVANTKGVPQSPAGAYVEPLLAAPVKRSLNCNAIGSAEISSLRKEKQLQNITVFSKATGLPVRFCVIFPRKVEDNFISLKIVNRLGFATHFDSAAVSSVVWKSKRHSSTGHFVNLSFPMPGSPRSIARRFHIVEDCPFDMLLGTLTTNSSTS